jgi:hypothetical protein
MNTADKNISIQTSLKEDKKIVKSNNSFLHFLYYKEFLAYMFLKFLLTCINCTY